MTIGQAIIRERAEDIRRIARQHGATHVRVIGSVARGEDREDSDIDLLVTFEQGRSLMDHSGLQIALEKLLGRRVEVASDRGLRPKVRERVLKEALRV